ncbi:MAG: winged helix-turn-helix domain-containing protein [Candidatus Thorarchaeota archaeon]
MEKEQELEKLRREIRVLRDTVYDLTKTIDDLKSQVATKSSIQVQDIESEYRIFAEDSALSQDASWIRLMSLLQRTGSGLTATEAAEQWGKSRSRTSEVLNKLVEHGKLVKYRDGREVKFRTADE